MKLRPRFPRLQLLFLFGSVLPLLGSAVAHADVVYYKDNRPPQEVKILRVNGVLLEVQVAAGALGLPMNTIAKIEMAEPPEWATAKRLFAAKDYGNAVISVRGLVDKYKGLPLDWAAQVTGMLGDIYVAIGDLSRADAAYQDFQKIYPGVGSMQAEVGRARILVATKKFAQAKAKLEPVVELALKDKAITPSAGSSYSHAFVAMGAIKESEGNLSGALEDYLRTVTIFYYDAAAVSEAQEHADALIARKINVP